jgi:hypothetical protein
VSEFVRKIEKAKWYQLDILNGEDISADAITICTKTKDNRLSVWRIDSEEKVDEAALAIISAHDHLDTIDIVIISPDYLHENGIASKQSDGNTRIDGLRKAHFDLIELTYDKLGILGHHIVHKLRTEKSKRYTVSSQKNLLSQAIDAGRLKKEDLNESVRRKL